MAVRDLFKVDRKTFINPAGWIDFDALRSYTATIRDVLRPTFTTPTPVREESFEEAMKRLDLTEKDVRSTKKNYRIIALVFLILGIILFMYSLYLLLHVHTFPGFLLGISAAALFLSQAFKYDFWAFQMSERRLGATFQEWKKSIFGNKKGTSS